MFYILQKRGNYGLKKNKVEGPNDSNGLLRDAI